MSIERTHLIKPKRFFDLENPNLHELCMRKMENLTDIDDIDSFTRPYRGYWNFSQGCTIVCGIILIYIYMILDLRQNFTDPLEQTSKKLFYFNPQIQALLESQNL